MAKIKILFVCTANVNRSRTAEDILKDSEHYEVRSAGFMKHPDGGQMLTQELVDWADQVFVMDEMRDGHLSRLCSDFNVSDKTLYVLNVRDIYLRGDPMLIEILKIELRRMDIKI